MFMNKTIIYFIVSSLDGTLFPSCPQCIFTLSVSVLCLWLLWKSHICKKKRNLSECKVHTGLWEVCNDKNTYFFPEPVNGSAIFNMGFKRQQHKKMIHSNSTLLNESKRQVFWLYACEIKLDAIKRYFKDHAITRRSHCEFIKGKSCLINLIPI